MTKMLEDLRIICDRYQEELDGLKERFETFKKELSKCKTALEDYKVENDYLVKNLEAGNKFFDILIEYVHKYDDINYKEVVNTISTGYLTVTRLYRELYTNIITQR